MTTETKTQITQGEWKVDDSIEYEISVVSPWTDKHQPRDSAVFGDYRGGIICSMNYNGGVPTKEQALANAKLIAAAPDLLSALIKLHDWILIRNSDNEELKKARYIIKKATL